MPTSTQRRAFQSSCPILLGPPLSLAQPVSGSRVRRAPPACRIEANRSRRYASAPLCGRPAMAPGAGRRLGAFAFWRARRPGGGYFRDGACPKGPPALTLQPTQAHRHDLSETHNKTISAYSLGTGFRPPHDFRRPGGRGARARDYRDALKEGRPGTRIVDAKGGAVRTWGPSDQVSSLTDRAAKPPGSTT
jgi:hypothetical protein